MRRLPIYFVVDISDSMVGEPIAQVEKGLRSIINELRGDPYALETVFVSVIAFAGKAEALCPLTELYKFQTPNLPIGEGTALGGALEYLMRDLDRSVQKTTAEVKGDWKPIVFLFTDGVPTDNPDKAVEQWNRKYRRACNLVAVSLGDGANTKVLSSLTENVLRLGETTPKSFSTFFKWVTASIKTSSVSVSDYGDDGLRLASHDGIDLEKVDPRELSEGMDETMAVIPAKCSSTRRMFLMKFLTQEDGAYVFEGAYAIDGDAYERFSSSGSKPLMVNSQNLIGGPESCPCCGNRYYGICICGKCSCNDGESGKCPWCDLEWEGFSHDSRNVSRGHG